MNESYKGMTPKQSKDVKKTKGEIRWLPNKRIIFRFPIRMIGVVFIGWMTWNNIEHSKEITSLSSSSPLLIDHVIHKAPMELMATETSDESQMTSSNSTTKTTTTKTVLGREATTKILGFADYKYREYAIKWFYRLANLGYTEHVIVAVDHKAINFFNENFPSNTTFQIGRVEEQLSPSVNWEPLPFPPCMSAGKHGSRVYRRQLFGRRWAYIYDQLQQGHHVLLTDVDNVFLRYHPMKAFEDANTDIFYAYSTSYPTYVFDDMGFTVCGGMAWLRAIPAVTNFVGSLVNKCKCMALFMEKEHHKNDEPDNKVCRDCQCDDQVQLNELLWKGKHKIIWDRNLSKPISRQDYPWDGINGISTKTRHKVTIWDRNFAYRAVMPNECPPKNWVAMPLYVDRGEVVTTWDTLCQNYSHGAAVTILDLKFGCDDDGYENAIAHIERYINPPREDGSPWHYDAVEEKIVYFDTPNNPMSDHSASSWSCLSTARFIYSLPQWTNLDLQDEEEPKEPKQTIIALRDVVTAGETMRQPFVNPAVLQANETGALVWARSGPNGDLRYVRTRRLTALGFEPIMNWSEMQTEREVLLDFVAKNPPRRRHRILSVPLDFLYGNSFGTDNTGVYGTMSWSGTGPRHRADTQSRNAYY